MKTNLISLVIELGDPKYGLAKFFGYPPNGLYIHFFTGKEVRNRSSKSLLLVLIDFGVSLQINEARDLHDHLISFCKEYGAEHQKTIEEDDSTNWTGVMEGVWMTRLVDIFHNLKNAPPEYTGILRLHFDYHRNCAHASGVARLKRTALKKECLLFVSNK